MVTLSISYVIGADICLPAPYVNVVVEICGFMRLHYTDCGFRVMFQCFSRHNLRYIKKKIKISRICGCLMPILLSRSGGSCMFIIGGSHVHVFICALHAAQLQTRIIYIYIYSQHAYKHTEYQWQPNQAILIEPCRHFA